MSPTGQYHGGLHFTETGAHSLPTFCKSACESLRAFGCHIERQTRVDDTHIRITCNRYVLKLSYRRHGADEMRLGLALCPIDAGQAEEARHLLAQLLDVLGTEFSPDRIEWLGADAPLPLQRRMAALNGYTAGPFARPPLHRAARTRRLTAPVSTSDQAELASAFRTQPAVIAPRAPLNQVAVWGITGVIATLSAPIAIGVASLNIALGGAVPVQSGLLAAAVGVVFTQPSEAAAALLRHLPF